MQMNKIKNLIQYLPGIFVLIYVLVLIISQTVKQQLFKFILFGIIAAIGASFSWTYACFLWRTNTKFFKPLDINFLKNLIAFLIFLPFVIRFNYEISYKFIFILFLSGIIGIGLGDTFYLKSLKLVGTRKTLSIEALSPLFASFSSDLFIDERLPIKAWLGIIIVTFSIFLIIRKQTYPPIKISPLN